MTTTATENELKLVDSDGDELGVERIDGKFVVHSVDADTGAERVAVVVPPATLRLFAARLFRFAMGGDGSAFVVLDEPDETPSSPLCRAIDALRTAADELEQLPDEARRPAPIFAPPLTAVAMRREADHLERLAELVSPIATNTTHEGNTE